MDSFKFKEWLLSEYKSPLLMGILNITPDSFSDGGSFLTLDAAIARAENMILDGADIIDIGGESTRPGAGAVSVQEELDRLMPVIEAIREMSDICLSVDTTKPEVMAAAVDAGVTIVNDTNALQADGALETVAKYQIPVCLMHMKGKPESMQQNVFYQGSVIDEVNAFFEQRIAACLQAGIAAENIILDPGFGFGKLVNHNLLLVQLLQSFKYHNLPIMMGASRKHTIGVVLGKPPQERLTGSLVTHAIALMNGADLIRAHDIAETRQTIIMTRAIMQASETMLNKENCNGSA
ncbi:dihydropteroate synthase [Legionella dresdenensis]|uniref:Dihydropteroate synthase n=1 Tax=Legionella dresdenensis TaxID=450200 RepID=A0ABV8CF15_9GAMM